MAPEPAANRRANPSARIIPRACAPLLASAAIAACASTSNDPGFAAPAPSATAGGADAGGSPWPTGINTPGTPPGTIPGAPPGSGDGGGSEDAASPAPPGPVRCPAGATLKPGDEKTIALTHAGVARSYLVHVGRAAMAGTAAPLVVNVHGLNNSPAIQVAFSGMNPLADTRGLVVVYPQGLNASFNAGGCCGQSSSSGVDDMGFIRAIVADVETQVCIDPHRVYATGFSNGGYMAYRLGCEASDLFAAIAPVEGANASPTCAPPRPVPVIAFHGDADPIVSYATGKQSLTDWVARDGCAATPTHTAFGTSSCDEWDGCNGGAKVKLCTIAGGSHLWPGAGSAIPATPVILDFFAQFALP